MGWIRSILLASRDSGIRKKLILNRLRFDFVAAERARAAEIAPFAPSRAARLTSSRVRSSSRSSPRHPGSRFPQSVSTMAAQSAAARAQFSAPAAIKRGARARARGAAGRSQTRLGGRGVILASTGGGAPVDADVVRAPRPEYIPNKIDDPNYVRVFDTTLRDGEQSPGTNPTRRFDHPRDPRFRTRRRS